MRNVLLAAAGVLMILVLVVYGRRCFSGSEASGSPDELARLSLEAASPEEQEEAAAQLAQLGEPAREHLRRVLQQSQVAEVRAVCLQGLGAMFDYDSMDLMIRMLGDRSVLVRGRAGAAVARMLGRDYFFRANAPPAQRAKAASKMKKDWEEMRDSVLLRNFKKELQERRESDE